ncbi:MAG: acyltransferase [Deltaproteobacteria bacterium]|nr:acyltransferase [Deltaproteobacteria bacterium]
MKSIQTNKVVKPEKLNALTALRFFAAGLIVLHHSFEPFQFGTSINAFFPTHQAVSFFFILSGFILTYVYKDFHSPGSVRRFFIARIARVWPLHCVTLLLTLVIFSGWYSHQITEPGSLKTFWIPLASNFFLLQSWVPLSEFYYSFNAVSWSISTEFGLYLLFPLLLAGFSRNWAFKLVGTLTFTIVITILLHYLSVKNTMTILGVVGHNPVARSFEFTSGMVMALLYNRIKHTYKPARIAATLIELTALAGSLVGMSMSLFLGSYISSFFAVPGRLWVAVGNSNVIFVAPFILLMALAKGEISKILSKPVFVFLGEISFSIYLLHQILIRAYSFYFEKFIMPPTWITYGYFIVLVLLGSYLLWEFIEKPCQKLILNWGKNNTLSTLKNEVTTIIAKKQVLFSILILMGLFSPLAWLKPVVPGVAMVEQARVESMTAKSLKEFRNIHFGTDFLLKGIVVDLENNHSLQLVWESLESVQLKYRVAVHFLDQQGEIASQADYYQSNLEGHKGKVRKNTFWIDEINLSNASKNIQSIGLALFTESDMKLLPVSGGPRDWNNTRLIIPLTRQISQRKG